MLSPETLARSLRRATLLFLTLPLMIFFAGWLRWPLALATCGALAAALWRDEAGRPEAAPQPATISRLGLCLALGLPALVLTALSGAGGWGAGDADWLKHDTILRDLLGRPWPVTYESGRGPVLLVYYVAYYLPAALLGKLAGHRWLVASQTLALTTFIGIMLAGGWMVALSRIGGARPPDRGRPALRATLVAAAVFFGFSGLDVLGKMAVNLYVRLPALYGNWSDVEWWAQFAQYSSNAATVFWAPQHAFGGWLPAALALDDWFRDRGPQGRGALYVALALAWSPFAALGLLPLVGGLTLWRGAATPRAGPRLLTVANAAGMLAGGMFTLFLAARFQDYPLPARYKVTPGFLPTPLLAAVPWTVLYLGFVCVEFAGFSVALAGFFGRQRRERAPLWLATAVLLALPWFRYGYANDLVMRGGIPALFMLQVLLARMFTAAGNGWTWRQRLAAALAAAVFIGGLGNTFLEYRRHVVRLAAQGSWRDPRTSHPVLTLAELHRTLGAGPGFDLARQYLGAVDSPFGRYAAARRGALRPGAPPGGAPDFQGPDRSPSDPQTVRPDRPAGDTLTKE